MLSRRQDQPVLAGVSTACATHTRGSSMVGRTRFNTKRRIKTPKPDQNVLEDLATRVQYVGSPYHKRNPGDFRLIPPSQPRPDKTLCDGAGILSVAEAQRWLQEGVRRGLIGAKEQNGYPTHIWAVTDEGLVLEATFSGGRPGEYHGYPLFEPDPFRQIVLNY
jgi:hypothetical protein